MIRKMTSICKKIEQEVLSLPAHERIELIDRLIESLNLPSDPEIDRLWAEVGEKRFSELETGSVTPISGNKVFSNIKSALNQ